MAFIRAFGAYLPPAVVRNEQLAARLGCSAEWIYTSSGIRERRQASAEETVVEMAARAAEKCLGNSGIRAAQVGMLVLATGSSPRRFPGPAAEAANRLGLPSGTAALDVPMASAGALHGMALAAALAAQYNNILVIAAERMTEIAWREPAVPGAAILFGDGAGACLIGDDAGGARIVDSVLHSEGAFTGDLRLELDGSLAMEGRSVILQASRKIPAALSELLQRNAWSADQVDALVMHQANQNLMNRVAQSVGLPPDRIVSVIERTGNTSSASLLIAASEWWNQRTAFAGQRIAFAAFGAGYHWGALLAEGV